MLSILRREKSRFLHDLMRCDGHELAGWYSSSRIITNKSSGRLTEYQVIGRHLPTEANPAPKLYRMRIFAPNTVVAKSRFWYFLMKLRKVKKANGEIVSVNVVCRRPPLWKAILISFRSTRSVHWRSRTLESGSDMILARVPTTCTRSIVRSNLLSQTIRKRSRTILRWTLYSKISSWPTRMEMGTN